MNLWSSALVMVAATAGCRVPTPHDPNAFTSDTVRIEACLDLRDHIVDLYARAYVETQGIVLAPAEFREFRDAWANELYKRGSFERFEAACFSSLTKPMLVCGLAAKDPDEAGLCLHNDRGGR